MEHESADTLYFPGSRQGEQSKKAATSEAVAAATRRKRAASTSQEGAAPSDPSGESTQGEFQATLNLSVHSLQFRRALRHAARRAWSQQRNPPDNIPSQLARALLYVLWPYRAGRRNLPDAMEEASRALMRGGIQPIFVTLRESRCTTDSSLLRRNARLARLAALSAVDADDVIATMQAFRAVLTPAPQSQSNARPPAQQSTVRVPRPFVSSDPPLQLARLGSRAFFGLPDAIHPTQLTNMLVVGGTGAGKTASVVVPTLDALLRYRLGNGKCASVLVVDPKRELSARVHATLQELGELHRLVILDGRTPPIAYFSTASPLSPSERLAKLEAFAPARSDEGENAYWKGLGMALLRDLVQLDDAFARANAARGLNLRIFYEIALELGCAPDVPSFWSDVRSVMSYARLGGSHLTKVNRLIRKNCKSVDLDVGTIARALEAYTANTSLIEQFNYVLMSANDTLGALLADPETRALVDFDPRPSGDPQRTDVRQLVEEGKVIVFSPEARAGHRLAAQALKTKFFEAVFAREDQERPIGIVIDEAQRFITKDPESGEQALLDRCRAFRCLTLLATQSLASLRYELGNLTSGQAALEIILANTPSKFIFRATDDHTVSWLRSQLPPPGNGGPHIVDVRRPAQLRPGEAYYLLADGTWGRGQANLRGLTPVAPTNDTFAS